MCLPSLEMDAVTIQEEGEILNSISTLYQKTISKTAFFLDVVVQKSDIRQINSIESYSIREQQITGNTSDRFSICYLFT